MNASKTGRFVGIAALAAALVLAGILSISCYNDPEGIFYSLRYEQPVNEDATELLEGTSPSAIARVGDNYFLAAGNVFKRGLERAAGAWTDAGKPAGALLCTSLAASTTRIYSAFVDSDANNLGLYWSDGSGSTLTWTEVSPGILHAEGVKISAVMRAGLDVFVSTETTITGGARQFRLYLINEGGTDPVADGTNVAITFDADDPWDYKPILSMTYDGTNYWFISGANLFWGGPSTYFACEDTGRPEKTSLKSIRWSSTLNRLIVTTGSGMFRNLPTESLSGSTPGIVYARIGPNNWEQSAPISLDSGSEPGYANFTDCITVPGAAGETLLLVGSAPSVKYGEGDAQNTKAAVAHGYATFRPDGTGSIAAIATSGMGTAPLATATNFGTTLIEDIVMSFVEDDTPPGGPRTLFAMTVGDGLYSNQYDGTNWEGWFHE